MRKNLIIKEGAGDTVVTMIVWGVFSLLMTRLVLKITGYPQIGIGRLHLAHVLDGGLFMTAGMLIGSVFGGQKARRLSIIIFGLGMGRFVDEIGKFITRDNNYFYRPTEMIIYIFFVTLFLVYKMVERARVKDCRMLYYSVLERMEEVAEGDLEVSEKKNLVKMLRRIIKSEVNEDIKNVSRGLLRSLKSIEAIDDINRQKFQTWMKKLFKITYDKFFRRNVVIVGLWAYSIYYALDKILDTLVISASGQKMVAIQTFYQNYDFFGRSDFYIVAFQMTFDVIASVLFLLGAWYFWSKKRLKGIRYFRYGLLVSILFASIFRFYFEQYKAIYEVALSIGILEILRLYEGEAKERL